MWGKLRRYLGATFEVGCITLLCLLYAGSPPPGKNEPHYLGKARHYWQPTWCEGDFFYDSADAHEVFFWTFGWITQHYSLATSAWIGRVLVWFLFAMAWRAFVAQLSSKRWAGLLAAVMLIPLLHYGHLAGEWLIGGIEAKGFAYPLVFVALASAIQGRWWIVWPLLGLASCFHVLIGGWSVIAHLLAWWFRRKEDDLQLRPMLPWLIFGGLLALPGLWPALMLKGNATPEQTIEANITYSFRRLSHHLVFYRFHPTRIAYFVAACVGWWQTRRWIQTDRLRRLDAIVMGSLCIAAGGFWLDILLAPLNNLRAAVMRFYWFRLSDVMVPVGIAANTIALSETQLPLRRRVMVLAVLLGSIGFGFAMQVDGIGARSSSLRQQAWQLVDRVNEPMPPEDVDAAWIDACDWVKNSDELPPRSVFLTPTRQQTFKWYAQRPDVVTWKDVPQDAEGIVAWWERRGEVYRLGDWPWMAPENLANIIQAYGVTHVVWPYSKKWATEYPIPDDVEQLYRNELFAVYALPNATAADTP